MFPTSCCSESNIIASVIYVGLSLCQALRSAPLGIFSYKMGSAVPILQMSEWRLQVTRSSSTAGTVASASPNLLNVMLSCRVSSAHPRLGTDGYKQSKS